MTNCTIPPLARLKDQAGRVRARAEVMGEAMSQAEALEKFAKMLGRRDWNTLRALAAHTPEGAPVSVGDRGAAAISRRARRGARAIRA